MNYVIGKSGLTLPAQTGKMSKKREISVTIIDNWRRQLSLSDVSSTAKELFIMLKDSHQAHISYQERFAILSLLRPTLRYVCQSLQKYFENKEVLNEQQIPIADLVNALQIEMINGYKLIIEETTKHFFYNRKILITSMQSAMTACSKLIFHAFEQHRSVPPGIWLELHSLFNFAKKKRIANKMLKRFLTWQCRFRTLTDIYKHCLLFSIANPTNLRRAQIIQMLYALESWAPLLTFVEKDDNKSCLYVIDRLQDLPPQYIGIFSDQALSCYYINLEKINDRISKLLTLYNNNKHEKAAKKFSSAELALPIEYLENILNTWQSIRQRASGRQEKHDTISVCFGITDCHWFLKQIPLITLDNETQTSTKNVDIDIDIDIDINALPMPGTSRAPTTPVLFNCEIINLSETGCRLKLLDTIPSKLQTGEIIGMELDAINRKWSFGAIRWLKTDQDSSMMLGIELLGSQAIPVKTRIAETTTSYFVPTLLLAAIPNQQKPMRLIAPPLPFKTGNELEIEYNDNTYAANLEKSYSSSSSYHEFGIVFPFKQIEFPEHQGDLYNPKISETKNQNLHK
ncbi:MAG: hypothetical protein JSS07_01960 [Proteobacteria bacterium]|nr:hypothetical protein [Pseudomonadota bacterium]